MTQRERIIEDGEADRSDVFRTQQIPGRVNTYEVPAAGVVEQSEPAVVDTGLTAGFDDIRWGPVMAGLFTAISALAVLTLLGLAAGSGTVDTAAEARRVALGTGVWTGLSALLSFFAGGWVAARLAALRDERHALIHGAMVWAVAVPLVLYLLTGGLGALLNNAATATAPGQNAVASVADGISKTAWGLLASLLFGLSAATFGGWFGSYRSGAGHTQTARTEVVAPEQA